jgi:hypothetical protein
VIPHRDQITALGLDKQYDTTTRSQMKSHLGFHLQNLFHALAPRASRHHHRSDGRIMTGAKDHHLLKV